MQIARILLRMGEYSVQPLTDVTPAQAITLASIHSKSTADVSAVITEVVVTGDVDRTSRLELDRLRAAYKSSRVDKLFPGAIPILPSTFEEAGIPVQGYDVPAPKLEESTAEEAPKPRSRRVRTQPEPVPAPEEE